LYEFAKQTILLTYAIYPHILDVGEVPHKNVLIPLQHAPEDASTWEVAGYPAKLGARVGALHEKARPSEICLAFIEEKIKELGNWRGKFGSRRNVPTD
jgi:hypothetical protein